MVVVVPLAFRDTIFLYIMIWMSYALPSFFNMTGIGWLRISSTISFS